MKHLSVGVTGAGGFIGSHLVRSLNAEGIQTVAISGPSKNVEVLNDHSIIDILDYNQLKKGLEGASIVVHLAGLNSVRESFADPIESLRINTLGTANLLKVCKDIKVQSVIIISSAEVYGNPVSNPVSERDLLQPLSPYGVSKVALEQISYVYYIAHDIKFKILRPFSIYGPNMSKYSFMYEIYNKVSLRKDIDLFNLSSVRDYCYVEDLILAIKKTIRSEFKGYEVFNIGSGIGTNSKQIVEMIQTIMQTSGKVSESPISDRPRRSDVNQLVANIDKAEIELNWKPKTSLVDGLSMTIKSFQNV